MVPNASGADCYDVLSRLLFSESSPSACILLTLKKTKRKKYVPGEAPGTIFFLLAYAISIAPFGGRGKEKKNLPDSHILSLTNSMIRLI
jgi:hypothetical protein